MWPSMWVMNGGLFDDDDEDALASLGGGLLLKDLTFEVKVGLRCKYELRALAFQQITCNEALSTLASISCQCAPA